MKKLFVASLLLLCCTLTGKAQQNVTLYQMHDIVHASSLNPSVAPQRGWIIGIPVLSNISLSARSSLSYNQLGIDGNSINKDKLLSNLQDNNTFSLNGSINVISIGYRNQKNFFQLSVNERFSTEFAISKAPLELLIKGNAGYGGQTVSGDFSINAYYYREYAFNFAREIDPTLWVGARAKLMFGRVGIKSTGNSLSLYTDPGSHDLTVSSNILANVYLPGTVTRDASDKIDGFDADFGFDDAGFNASNVGLGLDLGATKVFELLDRPLEVSASVLNLGYIGWNKNAHSFHQNGKMTLDGPYTSIDDIEVLTDTLRSFLDLDYANEKYRQGLAPTIMAGANYSLNHFLNVGLTGMAEIRSASTPWAISATAFTRNLPVIDLGISYTISPNSYANIGYAMSLRLGGFNFYVVTDNILGAIKASNARYMSAQVGMNIQFGKRYKSLSALLKE